MESEVLDERIISVATPITPPETLDSIAPSASPAPSIAAATWALFFGLALLMMGTGVQGTLLGVRSEAAGFSIAVSGLVMTAYFVGFMIGSPLAARLLTTVGHIRVFAALASGASCAVLVFAVIANPVAWIAMRFALGLCMAGLYVVAESWLNDLATNATRGRILSTYQLVVLGGMSLGQALLQVVDTSGPMLFVVASIMVSAAVLPVTLSASSAPPIRVPEKMSFRQLVRDAPTGVFTSFSIGSALGTLMAMGAVYASGKGLDPGDVGIFMAAPMVGSLLLQWPIGWLSDTLPRRGVIFFTSLSATVTSLALMIVPIGSAGSFAAMFLLGGLSFPIYSLAIALTNDWITPEKVVGASSTLIRVNGAGAITGPLVTSLLMAAFSPTFFFWSLAASHGVIAAYVAYRIVVKEAPPAELKSRFVAFPLRGSGTIAPLLGPIRPKRRRRQADRLSV